MSNPVLDEKTSSSSPILPDSPPLKSANFSVFPFDSPLPPPSPLTPPLTPAYTLHPLRITPNTSSKASGINSVPSSAQPAPRERDFAFHHHRLPNTTVEELESESVHSPTHPPTHQTSTQLATPSISSQGAASTLPSNDQDRESASDEFDYYAFVASESEVDADEVRSIAHHRRQFSSGDGENAFFLLEQPNNNVQRSGRFLFVRGVPPEATNDVLKQEFSPLGDTKGIYVGFQKQQHIVILAFFDIRTASRAHEIILASSNLPMGAKGLKSDTPSFFGGRQLVSRFVPLEELEKLVGRSTFIGNADGQLQISAVPSSPPHARLHSINDTSSVGDVQDRDAESISRAIQAELESFGDIAHFEMISSSSTGAPSSHGNNVIFPSVHSSPSGTGDNTETSEGVYTFLFEFFDSRASQKALDTIDGHVISVFVHRAGDQIPAPRAPPTLKANDDAKRRVEYQLFVNPASPRSSPSSSTLNTSSPRTTAIGLDIPTPTQILASRQSKTTNESDTSKPSSAATVTSSVRNSHWTRRSSTGSATFLPGELTLLQQRLALQAREKQKEKGKERARLLLEQEKLFTKSGGREPRAARGAARGGHGHNASESRHPTESSSSMITVEDGSRKRGGGEEGGMDNHGEDEDIVISSPKRRKTLTLPKTAPATPRREQVPLPPPSAPHTASKAVNGPSRTRYRHQSIDGFEESVTSSILEQLNAEDGFGFHGFPGGHDDAENLQDKHLSTDGDTDTLALTNHVRERLGYFDANAHPHLQPPPGLHPQVIRDFWQPPPANNNNRLVGSQNQNEDRNHGLPSSQDHHDHDELEPISIPQYQFEHPPRLAEDSNGSRGSGSYAGHIDPQHAPPMPSTMHHMPTSPMPMPMPMSPMSPHPYYLPPHLFATPTHDWDGVSYGWFPSPGPGPVSPGGTEPFAPGVQLQPGALTAPYTPVNANGSGVPEQNQHQLQFQHPGQLHHYSYPMLVHPGTPHAQQQQQQQQRTPNGGMQQPMTPQQQQERINQVYMAHLAQLQAQQGSPSAFSGAHPGTYGPSPPHLVSMAAGSTPVLNSQSDPVHTPPQPIGTTSSRANGANGGAVGTDARSQESTSARPVPMSFKNPRWRGNAPIRVRLPPSSQQQDGAVPLDLSRAPRPILIPTRRLHSNNNHHNMGSSDTPPKSTSPRSPTSAQSPSSYGGIHVPHHQTFVPGPSHHPSMSAFGHAGRGGGIAVARERKPTPEANIVDVDKIEDGLDTRTTVMLKNVPNKMTAKDLLAFIDAVCPCAIDFLYLRIDFANHCNVGYAFVNFIDATDLLKFCKASLGKKWNLFQSEKVLQMSYANYQGKAALVDKFRNSAVLNERPEWRPQLFYSDGPERGLPHSFPPPNSAMRQERSALIKNDGMYSHPHTTRLNNRDRRISS